MTRRVRALLLISLSAVLGSAACGDDDGDTTPTDGGSLPDVPAVPDSGPPDAGPPPEPVDVTTSHGPVTGLDHGAYSAFLGIPYAAPPVGPGRFQPPVPPTPWTEPRDASAFGPSCMQPDSILFGAPGEQSEDCLTVNVWTPNLTPAEPLPVMVWIHGGAFVIGSSATDLYDGARLAAERGVVVVSMNYRLGIFGFLAHPALVAEDENGSAGNYGFLDQVLALEWVRDNAAAFGGDPENVTAFGESAGGMSVCLHVLSPLSAGLFDRAIMESGSCAVVRTPLHDTEGGQRSAEDLGRSFTEVLGCDTAPDVAACLRGKTAEELIAVTPPTSGPDLLSRNDRFNPNVDGWAIPELPIDAMVAGRFGGVPIIAGVTRDEANLFTLGLTIDDDAQYAANVDAIYPGLSDEVLAAYPASAFGDDPKAAFSAFFTDIAFVCPTRLALRAAADRPDDLPVHGYYFTRVNPGLGALGLGAAHGSEIPYVFLTFPGPFRRTDEDEALAEAVSGYWTSFADTGAPAGTVAWPEFEAGTETQLELGDTIRTVDGVRIPECDRIAGWVGVPTM